MELYDQDVVEFLSATYVFNAATPQVLMDILPLFEILEYGRNQFVISQGDLDEHLYLVYQGRVRQTFTTQSETRNVGLAHRGDVLNLEMLTPGTPSITSLRTVSETVLLRINYENMRQAVAQVPQAYENLIMLLESFKAAQRKTFEFKEPDEIIYFYGRRHPAFLFSRLLMPMALFFIILITFNVMDPYGIAMRLIEAVLLVLCVVWAGWIGIDWTNDYAYVSNLRVLFMERVVALYSNQQETPLKSILSVSTTSSQLGRIFSFGNVVVRTYTGTITLHDLDRFETVAALIKSLWEHSRDEIIAEDRHDVEVSLRRRFGMDLPDEEEFEEMAHANPMRYQPAEYSALANFFALRKVEGETITYWTHWIYMLKALLLPATALIITGLILASRPEVILDQQGNLVANPLLATVLLLSLIWLIYKFTDWRNDRYIITPDQVVDINKKPLGREDKQTAQIKNILSIEYKRLGLIGILLNYGTVYIKVGDSTLTFDNVPDPAAVQKEIFGRMAWLQQHETEIRQARERERMAEMIASYHRLVIEKSRQDQE